MDKNEAYVSLRTALDSFTDVAMTDFEMIESEVEKQKFADFVKETVNTFLKSNRDLRSRAWKDSKVKRSEAFTRQAQAIIVNKEGLCPPGFEEKDGLCVRI